MPAYSALRLSKRKVTPKVPKHTVHHFLRCLLNLRREP